MYPLLLLWATYRNKPINSPEFEGATSQDTIAKADTIKFQYYVINICHESEFDNMVLKFISLLEENILGTYTPSKTDLVLRS